MALSVLFNDPHQYPASGVALEETVVVAIPIPELEKLSYQIIRQHVHGFVI